MPAVPPWVPSECAPVGVSLVPQVGGGAATAAAAAMIDAIPLPQQLSGGTPGAGGLGAAAAAD